MIRTAEYPQDYKAVKKLIREGEAEGTLQHRKKKEIKKLIRKGRTVVAQENGSIVGTASVEVYNRRIAEVRSLYVSGDHRGNGIAHDLVEGILSQPVRILPSATIFAISTTPSVFEKSGFTQTQGQRTILHKSI